MRNVLACLVLLVAQNICAAPPASAQTDIALGRPYTMSPRPNYGLTTEAGDDTQLTDGAFTANNPIWTRTSTVGWANVAPITIVIDLQSVQPIGGVSYSTAAGKAGVQWPRSIFVLTSDDGTHFFPAGDLAGVDAQNGPPASGYAAFRYANSTLHTHGRYVAIVVDPVGPYAFCDEIQVFAGDPSWMALPLTGESTTDLQKYFVVAHMRVSIARRLTSDIQDARAALSASSADDVLRESLAAALDAAANGIADLPSPDPIAFTTTLPLNDLHAGIFAVEGAIARADGLPAMSAWAVNPWDYVHPVDRPPADGGLGTVRIAAMNGETRAGAVNFFNATDQSSTVTLRLSDTTGMPADVDVQLFDEPFTDTRDLVPVADALVPLSADAPSVTVPAGMTRQVWVRFAPANRTPGVYDAILEARTSDDVVVARVPAELTVLAGTFPSKPSLHLGGWDYTDRQSYQGITPSNLSPLVDSLHALNVDSPWATTGVMPAGTYDSTGRLVQLPDTTSFDRWVGRWPSASQYCVYVNARTSFGGFSMTSPLFAPAVGQWITFWTSHAAQLGIQPNQLVLLLVDEPSTTAQDAQITTWAAAIKLAQPAVVLFEDPWFTSPETSTPNMLQTIDIVTLGRNLITQQGTPLVGFYEGWAASGRALNVYGSNGPGRVLDPYTYQRLQAWLCAQLGATGSFFWSFSDDAGGASWNEYRLTGLQATFSPFFLSSDHVTISKHSEAIREGAEDFEYLNALRSQTSSADLFDRAIATVLQTTDLQWTTPKDRTVADSMRLAIADALGLMPPPPPPVAVDPPESPAPDPPSPAIAPTGVGADTATDDAQAPAVTPASVVDSNGAAASVGGTSVIQPAAAVVTSTDSNAAIDGQASAAADVAVAEGPAPVAAPVDDGSVADPNVSDEVTPAADASEAVPDAGDAVPDASDAVPDAGV